ncbi:Hypothetical predicted protein, partial [Paramuricea clavata]
MDANTLDLAVVAVAGSMFTKSTLGYLESGNFRPSKRDNRVLSGKRVMLGFVIQVEHLKQEHCSEHESK